MLVERWAPEAALRQKAQELLHSLAPRPGATVDLIIDDSKTGQRGQPMEAVTHMKDPTTDTSTQGPQDICAILVGRAAVSPSGIRLDIKKTPCAA